MKLQDTFFKGVEGSGESGQEISSKMKNKAGDIGRQQTFCAISCHLDFIL